MSFVCIKSNDNGDVSPANVDKTAFISGFCMLEPTDKELADLFGQVPAVTKCVRRVYGNTDKLIGVFLIFEDENSAKAFIEKAETTPITYKDNKLQIYTFKYYLGNEKWEELTCFTEYVAHDPYMCTGRDVREGAKYIFSQGGV